MSQVMSENTTRWKRVLLALSLSVIMGLLVVVTFGVVFLTPSNSNNTTTATTIASVYVEPFINGCFNNGNVEDCLGFSGVQTATVNVANRALNNTPLPNATVQLYYFNMTLIDTQVTNSSGVITFNPPSNGTYYIETTFWNYFKQGGVEIYHGWILFLGEPNSGTFVDFSISLGPAIWASSPQLVCPEVGC